MSIITGYLLAFLAIAAGIWANVMVYYFVMERRRKRTATEEHKKVISQKDEQLQELTQENTAADLRNRQLQELLELTKQAASLQAERVGVFMFEHRTGERLMGISGDSTIETQILKQKQGALLHTLELWEEQAGPLEMKDGTLLTMAVCSNDLAKAYVVTDVTQSSELSRLQQERQQCLRGDMVTGAMNMAAFLQYAPLCPEQYPEETPWILLLQTDMVSSVPQGIRAGSRDAYRKACAEALLPHARDGMVGRYGDDSFCLMLLTADEQALEEKTRAIYEDILKARDILGVPDDWQQDRCVLGVTRYEPELLTELLEYLYICIGNAQGSAQFGVQVFPADREAREQTLQRYEAMQAVLQDKRIRYCYQPIVSSTNARIWGYEMIPYFPTLPFWTTEEAVERMRAFGLLRDLDQMMGMEAMRIYTRMVENGKILYHSHVWIRSLPGACTGYGQGIGFYEKQYDYMKNIVVELTERTWEYAPCAELKRARVTKWGSLSALRCEGNDRKELAWLHYLQPDVLRIPAAAAKDPEMRKLVEQQQAAGGTVLVDQIRTAAQMDAALRLNAEYLQGDYLGKAEEEPGDLQDRAVDRIAAFRFGKK